MPANPETRYAWLVSHYGDVRLVETEADDEVVRRVVPLYEDGILHDVGPTVRETSGEGRHGVLMSVVLNDGHAARAEDLAAASRDTGLVVEMIDFPGPGPRRELWMFVPLDDSRIGKPEELFRRFLAVERASVPVPRMPVEMPNGVGRDRAHRALERLVETYSAHRVVLNRPPSRDDAAIARAWELAADLRERPLMDTVEALAGPDYMEAVATAFALPREPRPLPERIGPERVRETFEGVLRAVAPTLSGLSVREAWVVLSEMRDEGHRETVEAVLGDDAHLVEETLRSNDLDAGTGPRP